MATPEAASVRLRLTVTNARAGDGQMVFGLQDKAGGIVDGVDGPRGARVFDCQVRVAGAADHGPPNFLGRFTHGPPTSRHLYLSHGAPGLGRPWVKRIKVPLGSITWSMIERARGRALAADVDGRRAATVPVDWRVVGL